MRKQRLIWSDKTTNLIHANQTGLVVVERIENDINVVDWIGQLDMQLVFDDVRQLLLVCLRMS